MNKLDPAALEEIRRVDDEIDKCLRNPNNFKDYNLIIDTDIRDKVICCFTDSYNKMVDSDMFVMMSNEDKQFFLFLSKSLLDSLLRLVEED